MRASWWNSAASRVTLRTGSPRRSARTTADAEAAVQSGAHRFGGCQLFGHRTAGGSPFAGAHRRCGFYRRARNQTAYADLQRARNAASALRGAGIRPGYAEFRSRENQGDSRRGGALLQEDRSGQSADYPRTVRLCPDHPFPGVDQGGQAAHQGAVAGYARTHHQGQTRFDIMARMCSMDGSAISGGTGPQPLDGSCGSLRTHWPI